MRRKYQIVLPECREIVLVHSEVKILRAMKRNGGKATTRELFLETHLEEAYLWEKLQSLMRQNLVRRVTRGVYQLTDLGWRVKLPE